MTKNNFTNEIRNRYVKSSSRNVSIGAEPNGDVGIANVGECLEIRIAAICFRNLQIYQNKGELSLSAMKKNVEFATFLHTHIPLFVVYLTAKPFVLNTQEHN